MGTEATVLQRASDILGLSIPVLQFLVAFIATLPVSWGWRLLPKSSPLIRHLYAAITGALLSHYGLPGSNLLLLVPIVISYACMLLWRRRCGVITFVLAFGFLLACHVSYMSGESWKQGGIDATGALMVLTLKVISAAMNYQDGLLQESTNTLRPAQKKNRMFYLPSPLVYLGYCLNCGTHLAGPVFELRDYIDWTENRSVWHSQLTGGPAPPYLLYSLQVLAKSVLCMAIYMFLSPHFSSTLRFFDYPLVADSGQVWPAWKSFGYLWMCGFTARWKFYFIWSISEASLILSGFGFNGWDQKEDGSKQANWDRACNVNIPLVEFNGSGARLPLHWNIHVGFWLRHYVYEPLSAFGGKSTGGVVELVATQVVTAVWHGLYIGYILFFVHSALMIAGARVIYKWQRLLSNPRTSRPWWIEFKEGLGAPQGGGLWTLGKRALGWVVGFTYASFILHYSWAGFMLLNLKDTLAAYQSTYYAGTILPLFVIFLGTLVKSGSPFEPPPKSESNID